MQRPPLPHQALPKAQRWELIEACRQLTDHQARDALRTRLLPFIMRPGEILYAAAGPHATATARQRGVKVVAMANPADMLTALQTVFSDQILHNARFHLAEDVPVYSARQRITLWQAVTMLCLVAATLAGLWFDRTTTLLTMSGIFALTFFSVVGLRLATLLSVGKQKAPDHLPLADAELPVYTILVPLFREARVLRQLLVGLQGLNYPALCRKRTKCGTVLNEGAASLSHHVDRAILF